MLKPLLINTADMKEMLDTARNEGVLEGKREMAKKMLLLGFSDSQLVSEEKPSSRRMTLKEEAEELNRNREFLDRFN